MALLRVLGSCIVSHPEGTNVTPRHRNLFRSHLLNKGHGGGAGALLRTICAVTGARSCMVRRVTGFGKQSGGCPLEPAPALACQRRRPAAVTTRSAGR